MPEDIIIPLTNQEDGEIKPEILDKIQTILNHLKVSRVLIIDDAINRDTGKDTFKGMVQSIISQGSIEQLRSIQVHGIDFTIDETVLLEHIDQVWESLKHGKQLRYFEQVYKIAGHPEAINDLNISNNLRDFFKSDQIEFLTPNEWDTRRDQILSEVETGAKIIVIFDQDLKLAEGRYSEQLIQGEQLILELKQKDAEGKAIISLLTHTISACNEELPKRHEICNRINSLKGSDFFVLAKARLENPEMFADGLKKVTLNIFCEEIKSQTIEILGEAQAEIIRQLDKFDTYDFDHAILKSSNIEGIWEPETLLRIIDVIFKDEVRKLMIDRDYLASTNQAISSANAISSIEFRIDDSVNPYNERFKLRYKEIYESGAHLNNLRKPIDNGDIFIISEGEKKGKIYILVAQECELMVRGQSGFRAVRTANLLEIETLTEKQLYAQMTKKYEDEIKKGKFKNHFFADRYKLDYFDSGTNKIGLVHFNKAIIIDLNVLDLIVFNETGETFLDLSESTYDEKFHNEAWRKRYELIRNEFIYHKEIIEKQFEAIAGVQNADLKMAMQIKFNYLFSFIKRTGIQLNYNSNNFSFGLKRISRLRQPKSKNLMDKYFQHLSRTAELHDFAE